VWLVPVHDLRAGVVLGHPVLDGGGRVLLNGGVALSERYLAILRERGYRAVYIRDPAAPVDAPPDEDLPFAVRAKAVESVRMVFEALGRHIGQPRFATVQDMIGVCRSEAMRPLLGPAGPVGQAGAAAAAIVRALRGRTVLAAMPLCVPDDGIACHRYVNAAIAAALIAERVGLHDTQVQRITHGTLLHDLGMVFLQYQFETKTHERDLAVLGYEMLKHCGEDALLVAHCAFEQFEHVDGSGLPRGIAGSNTIERRRRPDTRGALTINGEICAVAKAYDRYLGGGNGHAPLPALKVRERFAQEAGAHYNKAVVDALLRMIPPFPCGAEIAVAGGKHDGWSGVVDEINPKAIDRPVVVLYRDPAERIVRPVEVDAARHPEMQLSLRIPAESRA